MPSSLGLLYPPLTRYFNDGTIQRMDAKNELSMLKMVRAGRGDYAIINDFVGNWLINKHNMRGQFKVSKKSITEFNYRIMFSKKWKMLVQKINLKLKEMKNKGQLREISQRYLKKQ